MNLNIKPANSIGERSRSRRGRYLNPKQRVNGYSIFPRKSMPGRLRKIQSVKPSMRNQKDSKKHVEKVKRRVRVQYRRKMIF